MMDKWWCKSVLPTGFGPPDRPSAPTKDRSRLSGCHSRVVPLDDERLLIVSHEGGGGLHLEYFHRRDAKDVIARIGARASERNRVANRARIANRLLLQVSR